MNENTPLSGSLPIRSSWGEREDQPASLRRQLRGPWREMNRREFFANTALTAGGLFLGCSNGFAVDKKIDVSAAAITELPMGSAPAPVSFPHFPSRLHAYLWRNWQLIPLERMAAVIGAKEKDILRLGEAMGLSRPRRVSGNQLRRSYSTIIRCNWHLLPYEQLLQLLDWSAEEMAFTLKEDDFLFYKLGRLKPKCEPLRYQSSDENMRGREREIARVVRENFPKGATNASEPLFHFVSTLSAKPGVSMRSNSSTDAEKPLRFCYSYFALSGDPLLEPEIDPYPEGYLARIAELGVNGVWLQAVLYKFAPFPWDKALSARYEERLANLQKLVTRARRHGIDIFLYLNEPRGMALRFFESRPELKGTIEGDHAALCSSTKEVQDYLVDSVASIASAVPNLGGFFTITASENLTHCWSHFAGAGCPRCSKRAPGEVVAEVNKLVVRGIEKAGTKARLLAWDWGWAKEWMEDAIKNLPERAELMSVSEWDLPIQRGGVSSQVQEYSMSAVGPGPRALRHWEMARKRGLKTIAKVQVGNTWELSSVPYIPVVEDVAQHIANLQKVKVDGFMLGWTLGGCPSPNLEVVAEMMKGQGSGNVLEAMRKVAERRFGAKLAPAVVQAWREFSAAFREFPYHQTVIYHAPLQMGPANLFWAEPTNYRSTMVGIPYDDLDVWRGVYPHGVFILQLEKVADGFEKAIAKLRHVAKSLSLKADEKRALERELDVAEASALHFRSVATQGRLILARRALAETQKKDYALLQVTAMEGWLRDEMAAAKRLHEIQGRDSRIGFEASNHYYYVAMDLAEKVLNCEHLLRTWLPAQREKWVNK